MSVCTRTLECAKPATRRGMCRAHYAQYRIRQQAYGRWESTFVDAAPVRAHIEALIAAGVGKRRIADIAGVNRNSIQFLTIGRPERGNGPAGKVARRIADRIMAVPVPDPLAAKDILADGDIVAAVGTVRRLQGLVAIGWTQDVLARRLGIAPRNAKRLFNSSDRMVTARYARAVAALFDELQMTPGPSDRARRHAERRGWVPPLAWDEDSIDDPAARPVQTTHARGGFVERYSELADLGVGQVECARRLGITWASLVRQLQRHGIAVGAELQSLAHEQRRASA